MFNCIVVALISLIPIVSDLDFEYPSSSAQGTGFASLITELRSAFNQLAERKGDTVPYQITVLMRFSPIPSYILISCYRLPSLLERRTTKYVLKVKTGQGLTLR